MRIRFAGGLICLFLLFVLQPAANAQTVNGNINAAFAVGRRKESHEGVGLFCVRVTTQINHTVYVASKGGLYAVDLGEQVTHVFKSENWANQKNPQ